ncbi:MAG TPA: glycine oxidase ThiO [Rhizomicrobium sp.]
MKIVIIGAGVAGLATGWRLAQSGTEVVILERAQPASAATWAAAGMIAPTAETEHGDPAEAAFARWSADLWPDFAAQIEAQSGRSIGYKRDGALLVAMTEDERRTFSARNTASLLDSSEVRAREPMLSQNIAGALWDMEEAQVDNRVLGPALAVACGKAGAKILSLETAVSIETIGDFFGVRTPFSMHHANKVLVAAGAWSGQIEMPANSAPPAKPIKGEMIALAPPPGIALPDHVVWGNGVYLVPRKGRLLIGATMEDVGFDTALSDAGGDWLRHRAIALMPALAGWAVDEHWAGLRPGSPDGLPILGETATKNLFVATGQFRNGILFAPAVAETMCRLILGDAVPEIRAFSPERFRSGP